MQADFPFLLSKLNIAVNKVMYILATCYGLPQFFFAVATKASVEKYFSPVLGYCMHVALWYSDISWKQSSVQLFHLFSDLFTISQWNIMHI